MDSCTSNTRENRHSEMTTVRINVYYRETHRGKLFDQRSDEPPVESGHVLEIMT